MQLLNNSESDWYSLDGAKIIFWSGWVGGWLGGWLGGWEDEFKNKTNLSLSWGFG